MHKIKNILIAVAITVLIATAWIVIPILASLAGMGIIFYCVYACITVDPTDKP